MDTTLGPQKGDPKDPGGWRSEACRGSWRLGKERQKEERWDQIPHRLQSSELTKLCPDFTTYIRLLRN